MGQDAGVDAFFASLTHPLKGEMVRTREIILGADPRVEETIKWQTPTFFYKGNLASFNLRSKAHLSLLFHTGAHIPGNHQLLSGDTPTARTVRLGGIADIEAARSELEAIVRAWCNWKDDRTK